MLPYKLFIIETAFYRINPFSLPNFKTYNFQDGLHSIIYRSTIIVDTPLVYRRLVRYFSFCERLHSNQTADRSEIWVQTPRKQQVQLLYFFLQRELRQQQEQQIQLPHIASSRTAASTPTPTHTYT